jgi:hypothetical protein
MTDARQTSAKAFVKHVFINQERKLGDRRRLDTVVVLTINDAGSGSEGGIILPPLAPFEKSKLLGSGGSMVNAAIKSTLKGCASHTCYGNTIKMREHP